MKRVSFSEILCSTTHHYFAKPYSRKTQQQRKTCAVLTFHDHDLKVESLCMRVCVCQAHLHNVAKMLAKRTCVIEHDKARYQRVWKYMMERWEGFLHSQGTVFV